MGQHRAVKVARRRKKAMQKARTILNQKVAAMERALEPVPMEPMVEMRKLTQEERLALLEEWIARPLLVQQNDDSALCAISSILELIQTATPSSKKEPKTPRPSPTSSSASVKK